MRIHRKSEGKPCSTKKLQQKGISTESTLLQNNEERIPNCLYVYLYKHAYNNSVYAYKLITPSIKKWKTNHVLLAIQNRIGKKAQVNPA